MLVKPNVNKETAPISESVFCVKHCMWI